MSTVLVADEDREVAAFIGRTLEREGFATRELHDGLDALEAIRRNGVDLALLDLALPRCDGVEVTRRIRAEATTAGLPVIVLGADQQTAHKVLALEAGADDFLSKPFDTLELVTRVRSTLRRNSEMRAVSPLTGLPGNVRIDEELADRHHSGSAYAVAHVDIDHFKAFNDAYGFLRGDAMLNLVARCLREAAHTVNGPAVFTGHVGGDDFVVICTPEQAEPICAELIRRFDAEALGLHDAKDVATGGFHVVDRRGLTHTYPVVSLSIGIADSSRRQLRDPRELVAVANEMKAVAKGVTGSHIAQDRRST